MQDIQPKIKEIQGKYKKDPQKQNEEITKLYQESKINPMAGCLPLLIQMPILFGLFWVLRDPVKYHVFATALDFTNADTGFLWIKSLTKPDYIMAILSGASAFLMQKMTTPSEQMEGSMKTMLIVMTGMSFYWGFVFPAGLTIYWTASNIFQCAQYLLIVGPMKKKLANSKEVIIDAKKPGNKGKK
jgi:YidC/Oxa1 family membrane protein insertase